MSSELGKIQNLADNPTSNDPAVLLDLLKQKSKELAVVNALAQVVARSPNINDILEQALNRLLDVMDLEAGAVFLLDEQSQELTRAVCIGFSPQYQRTAHRLDLSEGITGQIIQTGLPVLIEDISEEQHISKAVMRREGIRSFAGMPLISRERLLGVMNVVSREFRRFDISDTNLLQSVANQLAVAVDNAKLFDSTARLAVMEERNWLAREIHDTLAQGLVAITLQLELALTQLTDKQDVSAVESSLARALDIARENLEDTRRSVMHLRGERMTTLGLADAVKQLIEEFGEELGIEVRTAVSRRLGTIPINVEEGVYRIAQEALANVRQHANAHHASVSLQRRSGELRLTVRDDGIGFDPLDRPSNGHYGIAGMGERASLLGGRLDLVSRPGRGTLVRAVIPMRRETVEQR